MSSTTTNTLYQQVQAFYARQMRLMDDGEVEAWLDTFTEDAVIANNANPAPARGRELMRKVAHKIVAAARDAGVTHRHWLGMLTVDQPEPDRPDPDRLVTRFYALVVETPKGGTPRIWRSTNGSDVLLRHGAGWRVSERHVLHDDIPEGTR